jgi:hypothetical protein
MQTWRVTIAIITRHVCVCSFTCAPLLLPNSCLSPYMRGKLGCNILCISKGRTSGLEWGNEDFISGSLQL